MTDNEAIVLLLSIIEPQLTAWPFALGFGPVDVQQNNQPTNQGIATGPMVTLQKLFHRAYGSPKINYEFSTIVDTAEETEDQVIAATYQFTAFTIQNPEHIEYPTASDLCDAVRTILQRRSTLRVLSTNKVSVLRVQQVNNDYFEDDKSRHEAGPSFDIVISYVRTAPAVTVDVVTEVNSNIQQVP